MAFKGWSPEVIEFYEGLEADNSKAYWQAHKAFYDAEVKGPMEALLAELAPEFGEGRVFRPNRDVRFSTDKSPYKTSIAAMAGDVGYLQVSVRGLGVGSGMWRMASDQLVRYRQAVADDATGEELLAIVADGHTHKLEITGHDALKTAPKGYSKDHPRIELLRNKGLIAWKEWPPAAWLGTRRAKDRVVDVLRASGPLRSWLEANVGPSELPEDARR
jgi:uncharacterized protein (TIGR02453 family)